MEVKERCSSRGQDSKIRLNLEREESLIGMLEVVEGLAESRCREIAAPYHQTYMLEVTFRKLAQKMVG